MIRFLYVNLWSATTGEISATTSASGLPPAASQNPDRSYVWRSLSQTANQSLIRDLGAAQAVTCVALANVKRIGGGTVQIYEGGSGASPGAYNLVATIPDEDTDSRVSYVFFNSVSARHWALTWTNGVPAVADTAEVGFVFLGTYYQPARNVLSPMDLERMDPSVGRMSVDGQQVFSQRTGYATGAFRFILATAELAFLMAMYRTVGRRTPIFAIETAQTWQAWLVRFTSALETPYHGALGQHHVTLSWEEVR